MTWHDTKFEKAMREHLISELGETKGDELYSKYTSVRNEMVNDNFYVEIKGQEPSLSDHGEKHIQDVLERSYKLIGEDEFKNLNSYEIYCLGIMVLFHDVGNVYGRKKHNSVKRVAKIYNKYRTNSQNYRSERNIITKAAGAHTGKSKSGCNDTLKDVSENDSLEGHIIQLRELASILRLADELAEGKQRTCSFLIDEGLYDKESTIFQKYAQITDISIDRYLKRISIKYDIDIPRNFGEKAQQEFVELIKFTYKRALKLDTERRYTKHYSKILQGFSFVEVKYNFSIDGIPTALDLEKIIFEDQYPIPGGEVADVTNQISKINENYEVENLIEILKSEIEHDDE